MSKRPAASVHLHLFSLGDVEALCKGKKPASMSVMQYACKAELKCTYLNPKNWYYKHHETLTCHYYVMGMVT